MMKVGWLGHLDCRKVWEGDGPDCTAGTISSWCSLESNRLLRCFWMGLLWSGYRVLAKSIIRRLTIHMIFFS